MRCGNLATNAGSKLGPRYAPPVGLNDAGCTATEAVAVMGRRTYQMPLMYVAQRRASKAAMAAQEGRNEP